MGDWSTRLEWATSFNGLYLDAAVDRDNSAGCFSLLFSFDLILSLMLTVGFVESELNSVG